MNNKRVNDSTRFYPVIRKYLEFYGDKYNMSELAAKILADDEEIDLSIRTLRRYISECLHTYTIPAKPTSIPVSTPIIQESKPQHKAYTGNRKDGLEKTYVVMGCVHLPFHNRKLFNAALNLIKDLKSSGVLTGVVLAGDILDMHSISRHAKGRITLPGYDLEREYAEANVEMGRLDRAAGDVEKVFFYGNHEMWYYDFMSNVDNHKLGQGVVKSPEDGLELRRRGYKVFANYKTAHIAIGDTEVLHGDYVSLHAAHKHLQVMKRNNVFFHTHRVGSYMEAEIESHNLGWMGDKDAPVFGYMTRVQKENWRNGFGVLHVDKDGKTHVTPIVWKNNRFYYGGKCYA